MTQPTAMLGAESCHEDPHSLQWLCMPHLRLHTRAVKAVLSLALRRLARVRRPAILLKWSLLRLGTILLPHSIQGQQIILSETSVAHSYTHTNLGEAMTISGRGVAHHPFDLALVSGRCGTWDCATIRKGPCYTLPSPAHALSCKLEFIRGYRCLVSYLSLHKCVHAHRYLY